MEKINKQHDKPDCILIRYMKGEDLNDGLGAKEHKILKNFWDKLDEAMKVCIKE